MQKYFLILLFFHFIQFPLFPSEGYSETDSQKDVEALLQEFGNDNGFFHSDNDESVKGDSLSRVDFNGHIKWGVVVNTSHDPPLPGQTDWRGVSSLRTDLSTRVKFKFSDRLTGVVSGNGYYDAAFRIKGRENYTEQLVDSLEKEFELGETYLQGTLSKNLDFSVGRQIVVWGTSDYIRVTDVLNPLDLRDPGLTRLEDLRLPVTLAQMSYYWSDVSLTGVMAYEHRFDKYPVYGSDFYPFNVTLPNEKKIDLDWNTMEWGMALDIGFHQWDLSFYLARFFNDRPYLEQFNLFYPAKSIMNHAKIYMAGTAIQIVTGSWLLKTEAAYLDGFRLSCRPGQDFSRWDILLGVEYFGFKNTHLSVEAVNRHLNNWVSCFERFPDYMIEDDSQVVLKISRTFYNDTLTLTFIGSMFGIDAINGSFQDYSLDFQITDAWSILTGMINYQSGDKVEMKKIGKNDRIYLKFKYSF